MSTIAVPLSPDAGQEPQTLPWAARPLRELLRLSWPIALSMLSYSLMTLVDTIFVARLGSAELAGVGLAGTASFAILCFSIGLLRAVKTLVSQAVGAGQGEETGAHLGAGLLVAAVLGVLTIFVGQIVAELLRGIAATAASGDAARSYLRVRALSAPLVLAYVALRETRYGRGDARSPMVATILANIVNVALAYLFIFPVGWGVAGAAFATVLAQGVEAGVLCLQQTRLGWGISRTRREHLQALWRIGLPTGIQFTLEIGAFTLLAGLIAALSEAEMAAHQIALQVIHFSFLPAFAVSESASVMVGQAVGADRDALVLRVARQALLGTAAYTFACTLVLALFSPWIVAGFRPAAGVAHIAVRLLYVAAVFQVFDGANMVARGALRGTGDVRYAAVVGVVSSWLMTPPLTWLLGYRLGLGALGGWLGLCGEIIAGAVVLWWRLERQRWRAAAAESRAGLRLAG